MGTLRPRINFVTLGVHNMVAVRAFYERLGLTAASASNPHVTFFNVNGVVLSLYGYGALAEDAGIHANAAPVFRGVALAWNGTSEENVDQIMAHAKNAGATIVKPAQKVFWGGYSGYFSDPEGNLWEVAFNPFAPFSDNGRIEMP